MKKFLMFLLLTTMILSGCAAMTYSAKDGTSVRYVRCFTASDEIAGKVGDVASVSVKGQKNIDPAVLESIFKILGTVK